MQRPDWPEVWLTMALFLSTRATCGRLRTAGFAIGSDNRPSGMGYNGSIPGAEHCDDVGHLMIDGHCMRTLHAEDNILLFGTRELKNSTVYILDSPCLNCAKKLISKGVKKIVYAMEFKNMHGKDEGWKFVFELAEKNNVALEHLDFDFYAVLDNMMQILEAPGGALHRFNQNRKENKKELGASEAL